MKTLHVKNLETYHPGYKDRHLIWCKLYFSMLDGDDEFEMLDEIDKWRFVAFIILELKNKKPIPLDERYLIRKGFDFKKRTLAKTLSAISPFVGICNISVTENGNPVTQNRIEYNRLDKNDKKKKEVFILPSFIPSDTWNDFVDMRKSIKKPMTIRAKQLMVAKLERIKKDGYDIKSVIERSIINNWQDVFVDQSAASGSKKEPWKVWGMTKEEYYSEGNGK